MSLGLLYEEGVEPTNNLAERGLRPAVIWRFFFDAHLKGSSIPLLLDSS